VNFEVITSFNQHYYERIGRDAVQSYLEHWSTPLTVYAEDVVVPADPRVNVIDFRVLGDQYQDFQTDVDLSARCKTFAKKAFAVIHAMHNSNADWLVWLDADVITKRSDPAAILHRILDQDCLAMYMGVTYTEHRDLKQGHWLVPETGVFGINLRHKHTDSFRQEYQRRYVERDFSDLRRSYDNDVFGAVVADIKAQYLDLCADLTKPYKTPLKHTVLGEYLQHYKAKHSKIDYAEAQ
jgi:hypothetical protein